MCDTTAQAGTAVADMPYNQGVEPSRIAAIIVETIEAACQRRKWSYADLAKEIGVAESTIHKWRAGPQDNYKVQALIKLFEIADASMDRLFELDPAEASSADWQQRALRAEWMLDQLREGEELEEEQAEPVDELGLQSEPAFQQGVTTARARRRLRQAARDAARRLAEREDSQDEESERTG